MNEIVVMTISIIAEIGSSRKPSFTCRALLKASQSQSKTGTWSRKPWASMNAGSPLKK